MKGRIFRANLLGCACIILLSLCVFFFGLYGYFADVQEQQLKTSLALAVRGLEQNGLDYLDGLGEDCRLTWIDAEGRVLYDTERDPGQMDNHKEREEIRGALQGGEGASVRYSDTLMEKTIYQSHRLSDGTVLRASVGFASVFRLVLDMLQHIALLLLAALILSLLLSSRLTSRIMKPIDDMNVEELPASPPYPELQPFLTKIKNQRREIERQRRSLADKRLNMEFAERSRREFTANVSHELKTPLQGIMGSAELIENGMVQAEDLAKFAGRIRSESTRLLALIDDIIHLSRLDEGSKMESTVLDLKEMAQEELKAMQPIADANEVKLAFQGDGAMIEGVPQLVREILHNLLDNAIKYNRPGGRVMLRIVQGETSVILSVADTGIGIAEEHQARIFERFYRVDKSHSKQKNGTGLGLSIVKNAAAYMNAEISLESAPNVGTSVQLRFPRA